MTWTPPARGLTATAVTAQSPTTTAPSLPPPPLPHQPQPPHQQQQQPAQFTLPATLSEVLRHWPTAADARYPPLEAVERDMAAALAAVAGGRAPVTPLLTVVEAWTVIQRGPYPPASPRVLSSVVAAHSQLNAHMLAIALYTAFQGVRWRTSANQAIKRSALQMAHADAFVEALRRQEAGGRPAARADLEGLAVVCIRAREFSRALAVLRQLETMPGALSPRVYKEMVVSAVAVGDTDRAARAVHSLAQALAGQEAGGVIAAGGNGVGTRRPGGLTKSLRLPDRVVTLCLRAADVDSCAIAVRAAHLMGRRLTPELATRVLDLAADAGNAVLAEVAVGDLLHAAGAAAGGAATLPLPSCRTLARAYANAEDVAGALRMVQYIAAVGGGGRAPAPTPAGAAGAAAAAVAAGGGVAADTSVVDDATWDAIANSLVCLNNRIFLASRQLRGRDGAGGGVGGGSGGVPTDDLPSIDDDDLGGTGGGSGSGTGSSGGGEATSVSIDDVSGWGGVAAAAGDASSSGSAAAFDQEGGAAGGGGSAVASGAFASAVERSLLGFGYVSETGPDEVTSALPGSAVDLLLPQRRANRWAFYSRAASAGAGLPEIALSFATNAAVDIAAVGAGFLPALAAHHDAGVREALEALARGGSDTSPRGSYSDELSARHEAAGTTLRGRSIEEVLQAALVMGESASGGDGGGAAPPPTVVANAIFNIILASLPRCRAGAFVAPTFQQLVSVYGLVPDVDTYAALLSTFVEPPFFNVPKAQGILASMQEVGIPPNGRVYGLLATLLARTGRLDRAAKVLAQCVAAGLRPSAESLRCVIRCAVTLTPADAARARADVTEVLRLARAAGVALGRDFESYYVPRKLRAIGGASPPSSPPPEPLQ